MLLLCKLKFDNASQHFHNHYNIYKKITIKQKMLDITKLGFSDNTGKIYNSGKRNTLKLT